MKEHIMKAPWQSFLAIIPKSEDTKVKESKYDYINYTAKPSAKSKGNLQVGRKISVNLMPVKKLVLVSWFMKHLKTT